MINVVGLGYIGLPTALMLSAHGNSVVGTDKKKELISSLQDGRITFEEEGLSELLASAREQGITFSSECHKTDMYILALPTPYIKASKKVDASYIVEAIKEVLINCESEAIIVIESTISPGTIDRQIRPIIEKFADGKTIHMVHAPERIIPGSMLKELKNNARVIGADDKKIGERVKKIYSTFCDGEIVVTDIKTAEMSKVVENTYRDINIAFANELAKICRQDEMDVYEIIRIANMHPRVNILQPGPGVGGHCISVDPWFLVGDYPGLANIILAARKINDSMPEFVLERIYEIMRENGIKDVQRVGLYGLTYKEDVDDVRESPTLQLLDVMHRHLASGIKVYDPMIHEKIVDEQILDFDEFFDSIDMIVIMVGHSHFRSIEARAKEKICLDTRNVIKEKQGKVYRM